MSEVIEEIKLKNNHVLEIIQDDDPQSPREWDNLSTMALFHSRYSLGDKVEFSSADFDNFGEMESYIINTLGAAVIKPVYMYDHSGITISTEPFDCRWDSGQLGFVYVTKEAIRREWNVKRVTTALITKAEKILDNEVETYDQYVTGEVYGFRLMKDDELIDSCHGFFGYDWKKNGIKDHIDSELIPDDIDEFIMSNPV